MPDITHGDILALTSPRMKGPDIEAAQQLLFDNKWGVFYHADEPQHRDDKGTFGVNTADACFWARYWLGHPKKGEDGYRRHRFDPQLKGELEGTIKLKPAYQTRRKRRIEKAKAGPGKLALDFAKTCIGEHENPGGSNKCPTTAYWGFIGAWCLMFVSRCYIEGAKVNAFRQGTLWAYNPTLYHTVKAGHDQLKFVALSQAEPGDIVQLDLNADNDPPDHGCLFVRRDGNDVVTLDGNWGDKVDYQRHSISSVMAIIRVLPDEVDD